MWIFGPLISARTSAVTETEPSAAGSSVSLKPLLLVDGEAVTSDASALGSASVTAEVLAETKGPKIRILKFKNKTGYRKRQGHRQRYTKIKITDIKS